MTLARETVQRILHAHEPYPALAVDRHWNMVLANRSIAPLLAGIDPALLEPPVNVLRLAMHPDGMASRIVNRAQWNEHLLARLRQQIAASRDQDLIALANDLERYRSDLPAPDEDAGHPSMAGIAVPVSLRQPDGSVLSFISTTTIFGTPLDITLSELAIEAFFPADKATERALRGGE